MQFISNGPDIPDELIQLHEEGRVVFFCGAGISYPARLPGFKGLVNSIFKRLGTTPKDDEKDELANFRFDTALSLLEHRYPGGRFAVRKALHDSLIPNLRLKGAKDTHNALLELGRTRDDSLRLVTTNFDLIFEKVSKSIKRPHEAHIAPMLPIPKNRWNGLVYLHGQLPKEPNEDALNRLVVTSGDFGLAYLTERWAARFVSELFRNYVVCFVGYTINDPVLRYMMDALAADRMLGETSLPAFAFGACEPGEEAEALRVWEAKSVTPILYEKPRGTHDHSALHLTLKAWAETYRDGVIGRERIIGDYAAAGPVASTKQDDYVGRVLWALSHKSGIPAKRFADMDPAPPLTWLQAFEEKRFRHSDLDRFGVPPQKDKDEELSFSLVQRPTPYPLAPLMALATFGEQSVKWDAVMHQLARWLLRYLNDPALILWVAQSGGRLHSYLADSIEWQLDYINKLKRKNETVELALLKHNSPDALPNSWMETLWRMVLTDRIRINDRDPKLFRWQDHYKRYGLTATVRFELREILSPKIVLKKPFRWGESDDGEPSRLKDIVDWELVLVSEGLKSTFQQKNIPDWEKNLPDLLEDFDKCLRDALDLARELEGARDVHDDSSWHLPSISDHWQNRGYTDWVYLIELVRDAWLAKLRQDSRNAFKIAVNWFDIPYPAYKRLALFAASKTDKIEPRIWVQWLVQDDAWWLWSVETQREVMRLIVLNGSKVSGRAKQRLEKAILAGPPRAMFRDDLDPDRWQQRSERDIWHRLLKLETSGLTLGAAAKVRLRNLQLKYPNWELGANERDEFPRWSSGTGDPGFELEVTEDHAPLLRRPLMKWLMQPVQNDSVMRRDDWREVCETHFPVCMCALLGLAIAGKWPAHRWSEALHVWSEREEHIKRSWRFASRVLTSVPNDTFQDMLRGITWWLKKVATHVRQQETEFILICKRVLNSEIEKEESTDQNDSAFFEPLTDAINHPVGHVVEALLTFWFTKKPNDGDKLPNSIEPLFRRICDPEQSGLRHGRVILATNLIPLFRVDEEWTKCHLLPFFDWNTHSIEARAVWGAFLWNPRLYRPLMIELKLHFLNTVYHLDSLGEEAKNYGGMLTYMALDNAAGYSIGDFKETFELLPKNNLGDSARTLVQAMESSGNQRNEYWKNRVLPFWKNYWPKSLELQTDEIARELAMLCIVADDNFENAFALVKDWIRPAKHSFGILRKFRESALPRRFPETSLKFVHLLQTDFQWSQKDLIECLDMIIEANPKLETDPIYRQLREQSRR